MHELYLAEQIIKGVLRSLPQEVMPIAVRRVEVEVGKLDAVVPETLSFNFEIIRNRFEMPYAELVINEKEVLCRCENCGYEFSLEFPVFICPQCGGFKVSVLQGQGLRLMKVEIEDNDVA